jgi:hypothetical protein
VTSPALERAVISLDASDLFERRYLPAPLKYWRRRDRHGERCLYLAAVLPHHALTHGYLVDWDRQVPLANSIAEDSQRLQDLIRRWRLEVLHDPSIFQEERAVCTARCSRVVCDHHDGLAKLGDRGP